jgi:hypothetical protein
VTIANINICSGGDHLKSALRKYFKRYLNTWLGCSKRYEAP